MPREVWPAAIDRACFDTWQDEVDVPGREEEVDASAERWGGFGGDSLKRMAQEGNETERLFALFAFGYLIPPGEEEFLLPFLSSPERKERWASAISLGRQQHAPVFPVLQNFLLEEIEYHPLYDKDTRDQIEAAVDEAIEHGGHLWERWADSAIVETWQKDQEDQEQYRWYTTHRLTITRLLGRWGDPQAIPAMRHVLSTCETIEQRSEFWELPINALTGWSTFLDLLRRTLDDLEERKQVR